MRLHARPLKGESQFSIALGSLVGLLSRHLGCLCLVQIPGVEVPDVGHQPLDFLGAVLEW